MIHFFSSCRNFFFAMNFLCNNTLPVDIGNRILGFLSIEDRDRVTGEEPFKSWGQDDFFCQRQITEIVEKKLFGYFKPKHMYSEFVSTETVKECFLWSAANGRADIVEELLKDPRIDPAMRKNEAIRESCYNGQIEVVKLLLKDARVDPKYNHKYPLKDYPSEHSYNIKSKLLNLNWNLYYNNAIGTAAASGNLELFKLLLQVCNADPSEYDNRPLRIAGACGGLEIVKFLIKDLRISSSKRNESFCGACKNGHIRIVEFWLNNVSANLQAYWNDAIIEAIWNDHFEVVKLLISNTRFNPSCDNNYPITAACSIGNIRLIEFLLKDKRVDPSARDNDSILSAYRAGHRDVVKLLLRDPRVDPCANNDELLMSSCASGDSEIVEALMYHPKIDIYNYNCCALQLATIHRHVKVIEKLLMNPQFNAFYCQYPLHFAVKRNYYDEVRLLIHHPSSHRRDNPKIILSYLNKAAIKGQFRMVELILENPSIDPSVNENETLRLAAERGRYKVVEVLLKHPRVDPKDCNYQAIRVAMRKSYTRTVNLLLNDKKVSATDFWNKHLNY